MASTLGQLSTDHLTEWQKTLNATGSIVLPDNVLERLSLILGIQKSIATLYPESRWAAYMQRKNKRFAGENIVSVISTGRLSELYEVHDYLETCCYAP